MMKKLALITALFVALSGCASLWERTVYERSPHLAQEDGGAAAVLTANSPETLKNVILSVIRSGERQAEIRVTDYPGELTSRSLSALLNEIQTREPIGAYAVEYFAINLTSVLSQHTITLDIVYKHEEYPVIMQVSGRRGLEDAVWAALAGYQPLLTVEMRYYHTQEHDPEEMARSFYYNNPAWAMELPKISVNPYPADGSLHRIIEMELIWRTPVEDLTRKSEETEAAARDLLLEMPEFSGGEEERTAQEVLWLHDALCGTVRYDHGNAAAMLAAATEEPRKGDSHTAYGALVGALAVGEGYAMAFKLLCDMLNIDCTVLPGHSLSGEEEVWNLVKIGEDWYHLSVSLNDRGAFPVYDFFLLDDGAAESVLEWDRTLFPPALSDAWTVGAIRGLR